jgi:hypothetical protein
MYKCIGGKIMNCTSDIFIENYGDFDVCFFPHSKYSFAFYTVFGDENIYVGIVWPNNINNTRGWEDFSFFNNLIKL